MDQEFFSQNQPNQEFNQGQTPFAPPPPNVFIRTSDSDLEKIQKEGGTYSSEFSKEPSIPSQIPTQPPVSPSVYERTPQSVPFQDISFAPQKLATETPIVSFENQPPKTGIPSIPEIPASELSGIPTPPSKKNFLPFIIIGALVIGGVALGYFLLWPKIFAPKKVTQVVTTTTTTTSTTTTTTLPPSPYISIGSPYFKSFVDLKVTGSVVISQIKESATNESSPAGTFKILIPKVKGIALTDEEVILSLIPKLPQELKPFLLGDKKFLLYVYYGEVNPSLGLIVETGLENKNSIKPIFLNWEKNLQITKDLTNFYLVKIPTRVGKSFKEVNNLGAEIRTIDYKGEEVDLSYAFYDKYLIIASSKEAINAALERLQRPVEPIYPF